MDGDLGKEESPSTLRGDASGSPRRAGARPQRWYSSMMPAWCKLLHSSASSSMSWLA